MIALPIFFNKINLIWPSSIFLSDFVILIISDVIDFHKLSNDTVLIGPSLNEGIDLPDDMCRFIVIMKVPYPSLTDELVKAKMEIFPYWYNSETSNHIIQGIGRGNRHTNDWCITYILDGCFSTLYKATNEQYSTELQNRIRTLI